MAYTTLAAAGTTGASGITTFTNRPAGAVGMTTLDANGKRVPTPQSALVTPGGPAVDAYTKAESDALLVAKADVGSSYTKAESNLRFGQLAIANTWEDAHTFKRYAQFTSSYLPGKVTVSAFGIAIELGTTTTNVYGSSVQFSDSSISKSAQLTFDNSVLKLTSDGTTEVAQEPTTPLGIAPKSYVDRVLASVQAPLVGLVNGVAKGFTTLLDAINARPSVLRLHADVTLTATPSRRFDGLLLGNGSTITVASGAELQLTRYAIIDQCSITGAGVISIIGSGVPSAAAPEPVPQDCVQVVNSAISAPLNLLPASNYQGLALRGNSVVTNLASGGGPVYLYDLAEVNVPLPVGFTRYDKRPGGASASAGAGADTTSCTASCGNQRTGLVVTPVFSPEMNGLIAPLSAVSDPGNNFNAAGHYYTAPVTGRYFISTRIRFADNTPAGYSYCQYAGRPGDNADQALFSSTTPVRSALLNIWQPHLTAGQRVYLTMYLESFTADLSASMEIRLISAD